MSELQRNIFKHSQGATRNVVNDEDEDDDTDSFSSDVSLPQMKVRATRKTVTDYSPLSASTCFETALSIDVAPITFRAYLTPPSLTSESTSETGSPGFSRGASIICVHGAGYSGLSWARFAQAVTQKTKGELGVFSYDCRGHGSTLGGDIADYSLKLMVNDLVFLLKKMYPSKDTTPSLVLLGHSMGGAVATAACSIVQQEVGPVVGLAVLDVVEGSVMEALDNMQALLATRPEGFESPTAAVQWHIESNTLRNTMSARISVPSLIQDRQSIGPGIQMTTESPSETAGTERWRWRTDLATTSPYWKDWFNGMSERFLSAKTAKLLVLAGTDRLDKPLTIAQMQGKFQLVVLHGVGHCVHEDNPEAVADTVIEFWRRNDGDITEKLRKIKKVGQA